MQIRFEFLRSELLKRLDGCEDHKQKISIARLILEIDTKLTQFAVNLYDKGLIDQYEYQ